MRRYRRRRSYRPSRYRRSMPFSRRRRVTRSRRTKYKLKGNRARGRGATQTANASSTSKTYKFKYHIWDALLAPSSTTAFTSGAKFFALNELDTDASSTLNSFEYYKITGMKIQFYPPTPLNNLNTAPGHFYYRLNFDDAIAPSNASRFRAKQDVANVDLANNYKPFGIYFKPMQNDDIENANVNVPTVFATALKNRWISTSFKSVPHYGYQWCWISSINGAPIPTQSGTMQVRYTYYITFKNWKNINDIT